MRADVVLDMGWVFWR